MNNTAENTTDVLYDQDRLEEIARLELTSPEVEEILNDYAQNAAEKLGLPQGMISVVLDEAQYFAAMHGVEGWVAESRGTPVEWSFCQHAVRSEDAFVVEDTTKNEKTKSSPLVTEEGIRCYAGIPLESSNGNILGTLCVTGVKERSFEESEINYLRTMASQAVADIENRAVA